ncbi:MAG: 16S rRNA (uracil(1498)-N(3))-methyltransferase [Rhodanobacter sp.]|nr:MAG: 16S rRNA (uracil(1498)-N(3))-methyltransferase [Rhodanobacter sp.]
MRTIRLHVAQPLEVSVEFSLPSAPAEHVARVLRLVAGDAVILFNGDGFDYPATLVAVGKREVTVRITARQRLNNESPLKLTLAQAVARGDKMDLIVQKATELGASCIVPLLTERSEVKLDANRAGKRLQHWQAVAASACEQCGRARLPDICAPTALAAWLEILGKHDTVRLALMPTATLTPREVRFGNQAGLLVVGPEGGLGARDIDALEGAGFAGLRLGPRILRTETAGLAALAALQTWHGDL